MPPYSRRKYQNADSLNMLFAMIKILGKNGNHFCVIINYMI